MKVEGDALESSRSPPRLLSPPPLPSTRQVTLRRADPRPLGPLPLVVKVFGEDFRFAVGSTYVGPDRSTWLEPAKQACLNHGFSLYIRNSSAVREEEAVGLRCSTTDRPREGKVSTCPFRLYVKPTRKGQRLFEYKITKLVNEHDHPSAESIQWDDAPDPTSDPTWTPTSLSSSTTQGRHASRRRNLSTEDPSDEAEDDDVDDAESGTDSRAESEVLSTADSEVDELESASSSSGDEATDEDGSDSEEEEAGYTQEQSVGRSSSAVPDAGTQARHAEQTDGDEIPFAKKLRLAIPTKELNRSSSSASSHLGTNSSGCTPLENTPATGNSYADLKQFLRRLDPEFQLYLEDESGPYGLDYFAAFFNETRYRSPKLVKSLQVRDLALLQGKLREQHERRDGAWTGKRIHDDDWERLGTRLREVLRP
ncbi:hypothetical protein JCM11491_003879 [Sporobolomyces phaffii]